MWSGNGQWVQFLYFDDYLEQEEHDKKIMETDTSTMDNESQLYFKLKKQEILARRFRSM
jgi:RNA binding exosome subunit